jgi:hypothetical protein
VVSQDDPPAWGSTLQNRLCFRTPSAMAKSVGT